jgi:hypothetical protein
MCALEQHPRSGRVYYQCGPASSAAPAVLHQIVEISKCRYHITINVPSLCMLSAFGSIGGVGGSTGHLDGANAAVDFLPTSAEDLVTGVPGTETEYLSATSVANSYSGQCYQLVKGWWSYELCMNEAVRQYRQEGAVRTLVTVIGFAPNSKGGQHSHLSRSGGKGNALVPYTTMYPPHNRPARTFASALFEGGDCDIAAGQVGTDVQLVCAEDHGDTRGNDRFISVVEVSSCRWRVVFASKRLCSVQGFEPPSLRKALQIVCRPTEILTELERDQGAKTPAP